MQKLSPKKKVQNAYSTMDLLRLQEMKEQTEQNIVLETLYQSSLFSLIV